MSDENDEDLWSLITRGVKPILRARKLDPDVAEKPAKKVKKPDETVHFGKTSPVIIKPAAEKKQPEDGGHGLDRRSAEKLRKGQMPIEETLDLHGMTQDKAYGALQAFILQAHGAGKRCVLVITGKGPGEDGRRDPLVQGRGVLKRVLPEWLAQTPLRAYILKTAPARPHHGGTGAMYVLLRRVR